ncbi:MAG: hypothetical protein Q7T54_03015 [Candidatus Levybacteria bacterium]|nr:hypothetical protein [Candidatus Levybacteria bacterium]
MILFANILTWILHPVVLTIPAVFLLTYYSTGSTQTSYYWTFISLIFSGLVAAFVLIGVKKGFFNNIDVSNRRQRVILYPFVISVVLLFAFFIYSQGGPVNLTMGAILFVVALIILDMINRKIKASIHVASVCAIITGVIYLYGGVTYLLLLLIPLVAWARIVKKRHTPQETIVGAVCGILLTVIAVNIVQFIR